MEKEVTKERIEAFLNGYNPMEHITNIECGYNDDKVSIIFDGKDGHRKIKQDDFKPFCWVKRSACIRMYNGDRSKLKWALNKAGIRIKELRSKDEFIKHFGFTNIKEQSSLNVTPTVEQESKIMEVIFLN